MEETKHTDSIMSDFDATMIAEGVTEADEETQNRAWQHLIDTRLAWQLQGWFGRTAEHLIEFGVCQPRKINKTTATQQGKEHQR